MRVIARAGALRKNAILADSRENASSQTGPIVCYQKASPNHVPNVKTETSLATLEELQS